MRLFACFVALVAALFFATAYGSLPIRDQAPFTTAELKRFLADTRTVMETIKVQMLETRDLTLETGNQVLLAAKQKAIDDLGWNQDRFNHLMQCCRDFLSLESLKAAIIDLESRIEQTIPQSERDRLRAEIRKLETSLHNILKRLESRTTAGERHLIKTRLNEQVEDIRNGIESLHSPN